MNFLERKKYSSLNSVRRFLMLALNLTESIDVKIRYLATIACHVPHATVALSHLAVDWRKLLQRNRQVEKSSVQ